MHMIRLGKYFSVRLQTGTAFLIFLLCSSGVVWGQETALPTGTNYLMDISKDALGEFNWMNPPEHYILSEGILSVTAEKGTDFFINPEDQTSAANAPYFYMEVQGDFVAITKVRPNFGSVWNACALMLHLDDQNWIKFAFENSDATGPSIVSVVTRGVSDDANGPILSEHKTLWLKMIRKGEIYAMHWSTNGKDYRLARLAAMPDHSTAKIGLEAQCPSEGPAQHVFSHFSLEAKTVEDLRKGE